MTTMNVLDSTGATVAVEKPLPPGQTTGAASRPVVIASDQSDLPIKPGSTEVKVTAATIGTGGVGYLGWLSTIANYLAGTLTVATHAVTQSGSWVLSAGSAIIGKVGIDQTTDGTTNKVAADIRFAGTAAATGAGATNAQTQRTTLASDSPGIIATGTAGSPSSTVLTVQGVSSMTPLTANPLASATTSGFTSSRVNSAGSTNATSLKASAGNVGEIDVYNTAAYTVFLKFYNKASAPTVGTDTPAWTIPIAAGGGFSKTFMRGKTFGTGIAYAITKLQADSDTTAVVAGDLTGSIDWV